MLNLNTALRRIPVAQLSFFCLLLISAIHPARAQNSYPATGDALIHGLTIGTGPGSNVTQSTALGNNALHSNNGGSENTAVGALTLYANVGGQYNTGIGYSALYTNTNGYSNTALGVYSLSLNTTGFLNTAIGNNSLQFNTTGYDNVSVGANNLVSNTTGNNNTSLGYAALFANNTGYSNVAIGVSALSTNTSSSNLVAVGDSALLNNTGQYNTAIGSKTLHANTTGVDNTALGYQVLYTNTSGGMNTASGYQALYSNQSGSYNVASGGYALYSNTGNNNTATGIFTMYYNTSGSANTAYGLEALLNNTTGSYNTGIGEVAGPASGNLSNTTSIGYDAAASASNSVVIGNTSVTSIGGYAGWTNFSDGRYKKNVNENVPGLAFINKLTPITYTLDVDGIETRRQKAAASTQGPGGTTLPRPSDDPLMKQAIKEKSAVIYTGFIAQDVDKVARSIGYNFSGVDKPKDDQQSFYGLRYSDFVVPLVKAVQELSARNDSLQQANAQLTQQVGQLSQRLDQIEQILGIKGAPEANTSTLDLSSARLFQNNPNPFNQTTLINYYLPQNAGPAYIQITGMNGETIKSIALNGSGPGQISLQTAQLASGTYFYSLVVNGTLIDTKKMVLTK